jgi:hypothetical protein
MPSMIQKRNALFFPLAGHSDTVPLGPIPWPKDPSTGWNDDLMPLQDILSGF